MDNSEGWSDGLGGTEQGCIPGICHMEAARLGFDRAIILGEENTFEMKPQ